MSETTETTTTLESALEGLLRRIIREEMQGVRRDNGPDDRLLTAEELADRLKVPVSWVYEQSRQGKIPTHRVGRYIRFDLQEVLASQRKGNAPS